MHKVIGFAVFAAAAGLFSHCSMAQQPSVKIPTIGFLGPTSAAPPATSQLDVFRKALADLGYVEGRDIIIDGRWPEGGRLEQLSEISAEFVSRKVDVIVAVGATAARAAKDATTEVPIVFAGVVNPVATGLLTNLAQPEGNLTGATTFDPLQAGMQLEILKEAISGLARVAVLGDSGAAPANFQAIENAARSHGLQIQVLKVDRAAATPDFDSAFEAAKREGAQAVVVLSTPVTSPNRRRISEAALKYKLPILSPREHADAGGVLSYGTAFSEATRRTAIYVDRILKGSKPGALPVETVRQHELVINLKAAREIGLTLPATLVTRASQVIQ